MRSTQAIINTDALVGNYKEIQRAANGRGVIAMIKANAYGHGIVEVARILESHEVDMLGVAFVDEGLLLRDEGIRSPILVLTPNEEHEAADLIENELTPVVCSLTQARSLNETAGSLNKVVDCHLYVDTGMRRDGFRTEDVAAAVPELLKMSSLNITGICTHLATADEPESEYAQEQTEQFRQAIKECRAAGLEPEHIHISNTGGFAQGLFEESTHVRPGLSLYGYQHGPSVLSIMPVMTLLTRVLDIREVMPGESVSYGRKFIAGDKTRIATLPIGYGDGYLRALTGAAYCSIGGKRYPIVGTICMDELMVDIGGAPISIGDEAVLFGADPSTNELSISAEDVAEWANTIPYEVTSAVSARVPRIYIGGET